MVVNFSSTLVLREVGRKLRKPIWKKLSALGLCAWLRTAVILVCLALAAALGHTSFAQQQQSFPPPPADRTLVYLADEKNMLTSLPFEAGSIPLKTDEAAKSDKVSYVEVKGASAATLVSNDAPRLYVFVPDRADAHPPFLLRLTTRRGARRVTAITQKGLRGFAFASEEIVKPHYRVLGRDGGMVYMEIRPREPLVPGEYAIVGTDLQRIATFRLALPVNP
jgi:hypothetical protein